MDREKIRSIRAETPGCRNVIHFNNAGAALMARPVIEAVEAYQRDEIMLGGYEAAAKNSDALLRPKHAAAELVNCAPEDIAIVENATRAWQHAFYAIAQTMRPGDRILTANAEYASNYIAFLQIAQTHSVGIDVVPNTQTGELDTEKLGQMVDERTKLIAVTHVPTNGGLVNPAVEIGKIATQAQVPYLLDACQSVGQLEIDVEEIQCDFLSTTGRKWLRAPRGTGFLYARPSAIEKFLPAILDDHGAHWVSDNGYALLSGASRFETFENNLAAKAGLGAALDYALSLGMSEISTRVEQLAADFRQALAAIPGVRLHDIGARKCGIVTFTLDGVPADDIRAHMSARNINAWVSRTKSTRLDMVGRGLEAIIRASVHYYNDHDEIERFCAELATIKPG